MKALSIKQPWASLIANGIKDIENRTWKTSFRGRIYIHSSLKKAGNLPNILTEEQAWYITSKVKEMPQKVDYMPFGAIIGEVDIIDCVINHESIWAEKTNGVIVGNEFHTNRDTKIIYNWVLANPVSYKEPILNVKGKLSLWDFPKNNF
ncbi:ASCH domain-containing protein [Tenacibaculum caenipelagi]|uniref:ASCH domain-containing protein n=1 Tax=Tenacibaculum caenipelagi TaxID=1325435 RepID=A0A4R6TD84_9FLAO|nr:ASCH domain-containing protein [Tenacibaculum caenipelagi]TDQ27647.1 ASCH domain-containing protein [Tenacibaculum caenipelagi]